METSVLYKMIDEIDWSQYETAYGNAAQDIPHFQAGKTPSGPSSLWALFSGDRERAMAAASDLWAGLCHQHAYVSSAALPAYDFLIIGLKELDRAVQLERPLAPAAPGKAESGSAYICRAGQVGE